MARIINVHHVDKEAFIKGNGEFDKEEVVVVFEHSPTYAELVERCKEELKWTHQNDVVELKGRHNVGFGHHVRWKIMRCQLRALLECLQGGGGGITRQGSRVVCHKEGC